ncbi:MAG: hypothetical protein ACLGHX_00875 [Acidimicrobiia bacterium]
MAGKGRQSFEKRQREADRQDRAREKAARRQERKEVDEDVDTPDEEALMASYSKLAERHAAGEVDDESFAAAKAEIFEQLGLDAG